MAHQALIAGVTGIAGRNLAEHLVAQGWEVAGLARKAPVDLPGVTPLAVDLLDAGATRSAVGGAAPTHVFFTTWLRKPTETENVAVNGAMLTNMLDALPGGVRHVALLTGTKSYIGAFEDWGKHPVVSPFREDQPRKPGLNFYSTQEDILSDRAGRAGFNWSVHRASTIIGYAVGSAMNMGAALAVYAAVCRETGQPFIFPGVPTQYAGVTEVTDARVLAEHMAWAATTPAAADRVFNIANGDVFRWDWLWGRLAAYFGMEAAPYPGRATPLAGQMKDAGPVWDRIVAAHGLRSNKLDDLAPWWHTDADLGREFEAFSDMSRSRDLGFHGHRRTETTFIDLFDRLKRERIIPA